MAGVAGLPQTSNVNGCDTKTGIGEPAESPENPRECRTFRDDIPLPDCARHLTRLRPSYGVTVRRDISSLIEQCQNYEPGNTYLARRMVDLVERIEGERG